MHYKNINHIKQLRKNKKITQKELTSYIGISDRNYRAKENGCVQFTSYEMIRLKKYFKLNYEDFFNIFFTN